jgi:hypothetical protein
LASAAPPSRHRLIQAKATKEHERAGQDVGRVDQVARELKRPRNREQPAPYEPARRGGTMFGDQPREHDQRAERQHRQQHVRRFRIRREAEGDADEQRLQRAWNLALRPHDVWAEERPFAGGVIPEAHQKNLRLVFEEKLAREAEPEAEGKQRGEDRNPSGGAGAEHRLAGHLIATRVKSFAPA